MGIGMDRDGIVVVVKVFNSDSEQYLGERGGVEV